VYGAGVRNMPDEVRKFRSDVTTALYMDASAEGLHQEPRAGEEDRWWKKGSKAKKNTAKPRKEPTAAVGDRSKQFVSGGRYQARPIDEREPTGGMSEFMMVRVAQDGWENFSWSLGQGSAVAKVEPKKVHIRPNSLVNDMLSSTSTGNHRPTPKIIAVPSLNRAVAPTSNPFRPTAKPTVSPSVTIFKPTAASFMLTPHTPSVTGNRSGNPFSSSSPIEPSSSAESDVFASNTKKRSWGNTEYAGQESKRRGMRMFSGARI
jgi:hypothetical protein